MVVQLSPRYKFVCDRCGKEEYFMNDKVFKLDEVSKFDILFEASKNDYQANERIRGQVCYNCYSDFYEIANNFFNEVNKESEE